MAEPQTLNVKGGLQVALDINYLGSLYTNGRAFREVTSKLVEGATGTVTLSAPLVVTQDVTYNGILRHGDGTPVILGSALTHDQFSPNVLAVAGSLAYSGLPTNNGALVYPGSQYVTDDLNGHVALRGDLNMTGVLRRNGILIAPGSFLVTDDAATVTVTGALNVTGNTALSSTNITTLQAGSAVIAGSAAITGPLIVSGASALNNSLTVSNSTRLVGPVVTVGSLTVGGPSSLNSTLSVSGNTTVAQALNVGGATSLQQLEVVQGAHVTGAFVAASTAAFSGLVTTVSDVDVGGLLTTQTLHAQGNVIFDGILTVSGATSVAGDVAITGNVVVAKTLGVLGAASFSNTLSANQAAHFASTVIIDQILTTGSDVSIGRNIAVTGTSSVGGAASFAAGVAASGPVTLLSTLATSGATTLAGTLQVAGTATLSTGLSAQDVVVRNTLGVTGLVTIGSAGVNTAGPVVLQSTLAVSGRSTFGGSIETQGNVTVDQALIVNGDSHIQGNVVTTGTTTLIGPLTAASASVAGNTQLQGLLSVAGQATVASGLTVATDSSFGAALTVTGPVLAGSQLTVSGNVVASKNIAISGGLGVNGSTVLGGTMTVAAATTLSSQLAVAGNVALAQGLSVASDTALAAGLSVGTGLIVSGNVTLATNLAVGLKITTPLMIASALTVSAGGTTMLLGPVDAGSTLSVTGAVTLQGGLTLQGSSGVIVSGPSQISTLSASGAATFASSVTSQSSIVSGTSLVQGALQAASVSVTGDSLISGASRVVGDSNISNLTVRGAAVLAAGLSVAGVTSFSNITSFSAPTSFSNTTSHSLLSSFAQGILVSAGLTQMNAGLTVTGPTILGGAVSMTGLVTAASALVVGQGVSIGGDLNYNGVLKRAGLATLITDDGISQAIVNANLTVTGNLAYSGILKQAGAPIVFGPLGLNFNVPNISFGTSSIPTAETVGLSVILPTQQYLGVSKLVTPEILGLIVRIVGGPPALPVDVQFPLYDTNVARITSISLFTVPPSGSNVPEFLDPLDSTHLLIFGGSQGVQPGATYTVSAWYANDLGNGTPVMLPALTFLKPGPPLSPVSVTATFVAPTATQEQAGCPYSYIVTTSATTDSQNPLSVPQPPISQSMVSVKESTSVSSYAAPSALTNITLGTTIAGPLGSSTFNSIPFALRPGTLYAVASTATNRFNLTSALSAPPQNLYTGIDITKFSIGQSLVSGAPLVPTVATGFQAAAYVARDGSTLALTDLLTTSSWTGSCTTQNVRSHVEPHPVSATPASSFRLTLSLGISAGGASSSALIDELWSDSLAKTALGTNISLTTAGQIDLASASGSNYNLGFFKCIPSITFCLNNLPGAYSPHLVTLTHTVRELGQWTFSSSNATLSYIPYSTPIVTAVTNTFSFHVDDTITIPSVVSVAELSRASINITNISGISSLEVSSSAISFVLALGVQNVGRYWYKAGVEVASVSGQGIINGSVPTSAALYSDAQTSTVVQSSVDLVQATVYYRKLSPSFDTIGISTLVESVSLLGSATNIIGPSSPFACAITGFRFDGASLSHPELTGSVTRVLLSDNSNPYPGTSSAVIYDHTVSIIAANSAYSYEAALYAGLYRGSSDASWTKNWATQGYNMGTSALLPDYSQPGSSTRYITFMFPLDTTSSYHTIRVQLLGAINVTESHSFTYKFVDTVSGAGTSSWLDLLKPWNGTSITSSNDGDGGRYYNGASTTDSNTLTSVTSAGKAYIRVGIPFGSVFAFGTISLTSM